MNKTLWSRLTPGERETLARFTDEVPVRVGALAEALGVPVLKSTLDPRVSGLIQPSQSAPSGFQIRINRYESPERQRFTIAHELAHYLLHRDLIGDGVVDNVLYRSKLSSRIETEANQLAADIVMPYDKVRYQSRLKGATVSDELAQDLAEVFRVSTPAMRVRLGLGLQA